MLDIDLSGRVAVVTGASGGIGQAICVRFLRCGAKVVMAVRDMARFQANFDALRAEYDGLAHVAECNIGNATEITKLIKQIFVDHKRLDILVNNAGVLRDNFLGMIPSNEIEEVLSVNLVGPIHMMQGAARIMQRHKSGSIINISSIVGVVGNTGQTVYAASKAGILGATLSAAKELARTGIRVNAIAPGLIDTKMTRGLPLDKRTRIEGNIGMGRVGTAEEVADVAVFLASDLSRYVTGQVIGVDGGLIM